MMAEALAPAGAVGDLAPVKKTMPEGGDKPLTTSALETSLKALLSGPETDPAKPTGEELQPDTAAAGEEILGQPKGEEDPPVEDTTRGEWPESAQKRVDKLTAQKAELREKQDALSTERDTLQERVEELESKLNAAGPVQATASDPLGFIATPRDLSNYVTAVKANLRRIEDHLDDSLDETQTAAFTKWAKDNGAYSEEDQQFNTAALKQLRRVAQDALSEHVPARMQYLRAEAEMSAGAVETFPWLRDAKSADYKKFQEVVKAMPEIRRHPNWKAIAAIFVRGLNVTTAEQAKGAKGNGVQKPAAPRLPGAAASMPQRPTEDGTEVTALRDKAFKSGNPKDMEALIRAQLLAAV